MFECLILGDSIGVGLHKHRSECVAYAKNGINTSQFNKEYTGEFFSNNVIISLGSNDHRGIKSKQELENLRNRIVAKSRVIWILPSGNAKNSGVDIKDIIEIIMNIAEKNNDMVVSPHPKYVSKDGIHPTGTGYQWLASFTQGQAN